MLSVGQQPTKVFYPSSLLRLSCCLEGIIFSQSIPNPVDYILINMGRTLTRELWNKVIFWTSNFLILSKISSMKLVILLAVLIPIVPLLRHPPGSEMSFLLLPHKIEVNLMRFLVSFKGR